jgi:hypothetical protein
MLRRSALLLVLAGCSSSGPAETDSRPALDVPMTASFTPSPGSPSAARDARDLERWNGQEITVQGTFEHERGIHGIVKLASGLRVWLPHFDLFMRGDDWLKYVGRPCAASGVLHTYTVDVDGHRQVRLDTVDFSGTSD